MAMRRMFTKDVVSKRNFLEMPPSSRALYYQLGVEADDDGFIDPYVTMLATKAQEDDLKILMAKGFVIPFESGVLVITHWNQHNYIRKDTYNETQYKEEKRLLLLGENGEYLPSPSTSRQRPVNVPSTQDRLGKDRLDNTNTLQDANASAEINDLIKLFEPVNPSYERLYPNKTQRAALERLVKKHSLEKLTEMLEKLPKIVTRPYAPKITTPLQFEQRLGELVVFISQEKGKGNAGASKFAKME